MPSTPTERLTKVSAYKLVRGKSTSSRVSLSALQHTDCDCKIPFEERLARFETDVSSRGLLFDTNPTEALGYTSIKTLKNGLDTIHCYNCRINCSGICMYSVRIERNSPLQCDCAIFGFLGSLLTDNKDTYYIEDFTNSRGRYDAFMAFLTLTLYGGYTKNNEYVPFPWNNNFLRQVYEANNVFRENIPSRHLRVLNDVLFIHPNGGRWDELKVMFGQVLHFLLYQCNDGTLPGISGRVLSSAQLTFYKSAMNAWTSLNPGASLPTLTTRP